MSLCALFHLQTYFMKIIREKKGESNIAESKSINGKLVEHLILNINISDCFCKNHIIIQSMLNF